MLELLHRVGAGFAAVGGGAVQGQTLPRSNNFGP